MESLHVLLTELGLSPQERRIYLYLLTSGEAAASTVASSLQLPRSTTRGALDALCEQGIVTKIYQRNTQWYYCKPPKTLRILLEHRIQKEQETMNTLTEMLPLLEGMFAKKNVLPKVRFYQGLAQVIEAFNSTLYREDVQEIFVITSYEFLQHPELVRNDDEVYIPLRVRKGISMKTIVGATTLPEKRIAREPKVLRERRFLPQEIVLPGTFYIFGDAVLYFSTSDDEYIAVITESVTMATSMRMLHQYLWQQLDG